MRRARDKNKGFGLLAVRLFGHTALGLAVALVAATMVPAVGAAPAVAATGASDQGQWSTVTCPTAKSRTSSLPQAMNGAVTECLRAPDVPPGVYHTYFQDSLLRPDIGPSKASITSVPTTTGGLTGAAPAVHLSVSPDPAQPGQMVTVTGTLAKQYAQEQSFLTFCWDGCPSGLQYGGITVTWKTGTTFVGRLTLPAAPWLQGNDKVVSPLAGTYQLGVQCVVMSRGCGGGAAEGEAAVTFKKAAAFTCASVPGCARLSAQPKEVLPGQVVEVTGLAPLQSIDGTDMPFADDLRSQRGAAPGLGVTFHGTPSGAEGADIGDADVAVKPAPSFASLAHLKPLLVTQVGEQLLSSNPESPATLAWCEPASVHLGGPSGTKVVPTKAAITALKAVHSYGSVGGQGCTTVALGPPQNDDGARGAGPRTIYAGFTVAPVDQGPMFATVAMYTTNAGLTWSFVPVPPGASALTFGGFRYGPNGEVDALFSNAHSFSRTPQVPVVEQSGTRGKGFSLTKFACPDVGPCLTLGAAPGASSCAMGAITVQPLLASYDGGRQWSTQQPWFDGASQCLPGSLVALSSTTALLTVPGQFFGSEGEVPALLTKDSGRSWEVISLPTDGNNLAPVLVPLPSGKVLDVTPLPWHLLPAGSSRWCTVTSVPKATMSDAEGASFTLAGGYLWWLSYGASSNGSQAPVQAMDVEPSSLACS